MFVRSPDQDSDQETIFLIKPAEALRELRHDAPISGTAFWNLRNGDNFEVAYGVYLYVVETDDGRRVGGRWQW